jgi:hypothetical protein
MLAGVAACFDDAVVHFPDTQSSDLVGDGSHERSGCSVHAKLMLLEFKDRMRVVVSSANLKRKHWHFRSEVVWVQDFPRMSSHPSTVGAAFALDGCSTSSVAASTTNIAAEARGRSFARVLSHFTADLLRDAQRGRQRFWVSKLTEFDFSIASAYLVPSLPGLFCQSRGGDSLALRLRALVEPGLALPSVHRHRITPVTLVRSRFGDWEVRLAHPISDTHSSVAPNASGPVLGRLSCESEAAVEAAEALGLDVNRDADLIMADHWWTDADDEASEEEPLPWKPELTLPHRIRATAMGLLRWATRKICWRPKESGTPMFTVRASLGGRCRPGRLPDGVSALFANLETNYGLHALGELLGSEVWPQREERLYAAISSSISWPQENWLEHLDRFTGRSPQSGSPGPDVVLPYGKGPIEACYAEWGRRGKLLSHNSPEHALGRECVRNHSKLLVRQLWDACGSSPYGWLYAGSHNFTKAAWGTVIEDDLDRLWVANRELGVLFVKPRGVAATHEEPLFSRAPLPFGVPPSPAIIDDREVLEEDGTWDTWDDGDVAGKGEESEEWSAWWWGGYGDSGWESSWYDDSAEADEQDW